jgi:hypothetical protein
MGQKDKRSNTGGSKQKKRNKNMKVFLATEN